MTTTHDAQRAMKIFFKSELDEHDRKEWFAITGQYDVTTKVLWDTIRASEGVAAVSASPQPSVEVRELMRGGENGWGVPQHEVVLGKLRIGVFSNKDSADKFAADVRAQFFAAAPAQEPRIGEPCPTCERTYLGKMGTGDYSCCVCGMGMVEPCEHWKSFDENAAQEQPVENSPQQYFCSTCTQYLTVIEAMDTHNQSHDIVRVIPNSPQRGKP